MGRDPRWRTDARKQGSKVWAFPCRQLPRLGRSVAAAFFLARSRPGQACERGLSVLAISEPRRERGIKYRVQVQRGRKVLPRPAERQPTATRYVWRGCAGSAAFAGNALRSVPPARRQQTSRHSRRIRPNTLGCHANGAPLRGPPRSRAGQHEFRAEKVRRRA